MLEDCAGKCGGDATLSGCDNQCNSKKEMDCDNVCGGTKILDCAGECGGSAILDCAGVCGGTTVCKAVLGDANSATCPAGSQVIESEAECIAAVADMMTECCPPDSIADNDNCNPKVDVNASDRPDCWPAVYEGSKSMPEMPPGCVTASNLMKGTANFNTEVTGVAHEKVVMICMVQSEATTSTTTPAPEVLTTATGGANYVVDTVGFRCTTEIVNLTTLGYTEDLDGCADGAAALNIQYFSFAESRGECRHSNVACNKQGNQDTTAYAVQAAAADAPIPAPAAAALLSKVSRKPSSALYKDVIEGARFKVSNPF